MKQGLERQMKKLGIEKRQSTSSTYANSEDTFVPRRNTLGTYEFSFVNSTILLVAEDAHRSFSLLVILSYSTVFTGVIQGSSSHGESNSLPVNKHQDNIGLGMENSARSISTGSLELQNLDGTDAQDEFFEG
jgi:hypothetical protein